MQFALRDMLLLMLAVSVPLAVWRAFPGNVGPHELPALVVATIALACGMLFRRYRLAAFGVCVMIGVLATPADPASALIVAGPLFCILLLALTAIKVARRRGRKDVSPE